VVAIVFYFVEIDWLVTAFGWETMGDRITEIQNLQHVPRAVMLMRLFRYVQKYVSAFQRKERMKKNAELRQLIALGTIDDR
jgi:hypothetical protein